MADDVISGYGRGQYNGRQPWPLIVVIAAWVFVLLGGPWLLFQLGDRVARALDNGTRVHLRP